MGVFLCLLVSKVTSNERLLHKARLPKFFAQIKNLCFGKILYIFEFAFGYIANDSRFYLISNILLIGSQAFSRSSTGTFISYCSV